MIYGEPLFVAAVSEQLRIIPLEPDFAWLSGLPRQFLHRNVDYIPADRARQLEGPMFIKPANDKCFPAQIYEDPTNIPSAIAPSTPCLASNPVAWRREFRAFVINRRVATISPYATDGELAQERDGSWPFYGSERRAALRFLRRLLTTSRILLPPGLVIDVGKLANGCWAVVEANPAWGSGIYGCDPSKILSVLELSFCYSETVPESLASWVPSRV